MTGLGQALAGYLELRRGLGFKLERHAELLGEFIGWLEDRGIATVTTADALAWVTLPERASPGWLQYRMQAVRGFAAYLATVDPAAQVPPAGLLPGGPRRAVPYLYSDADIAALFAQAGQLKTPLRQETFKTLIGLMAVTGLRGGEAIALDDEDFDPGRGLLLVRHAKLGRHRLLPLHPTTVSALQSYRQLRDQVFPRPRSQALLVSTAGTRLIRRRTGQTFAALARQAGLAGRAGNCRPRPHDLRHSFAVATLLDWCRDGGDVAAGCRCCRPTSGTATRGTPTGI